MKIVRTALGLIALKLITIFFIVSSTTALADSAIQVGDVVIVKPDTILWKDVSQNTRLMEIDKTIEVSVIEVSHLPYWYRIKVGSVEGWVLDHSGALKRKMPKFSIKNLPLFVQNLIEQKKSTLFDLPKAEVQKQFGAITCAQGCGKCTLAVENREVDVSIDFRFSTRAASCELQDIVVRGIPNIDESLNKKLKADLEIVVFDSEIYIGDCIQGVKFEYFKAGGGYFIGRPTPSNWHAYDPESQQLFFTSRWRTDRIVTVSNLFQALKNSDPIKQTELQVKALVMKKFNEHNVPTLQSNITPQIATNELKKVAAESNQERASCLLYALDSAMDSADDINFKDQDWSKIGVERGKFGENMHDFLQTAQKDFPSTTCSRLGLLKTDPIKLVDDRTVDENIRAVALHSVLGSGLSLAKNKEYSKILARLKTPLQEWGKNAEKIFELEGPIPENLCPYE